MLEQLRAWPVHSLVTIFQHFEAQTCSSIRNARANQTPVSVFSLISGCKCNYTSRVSLKLLEQMRAWPFHFSDNICQHFGSQTCISRRNPWASHTLISTISFKILLQLQSHIKISAKNPGANAGLTFPFLSQLRAQGPRWFHLLKSPSAAQFSLGIPEQIRRQYRHFL